MKKETPLISLAYGFAYEGLAQKEMGEEDTYIYISGSKLCEYLNAVDSK